MGASQAVLSAQAEGQILVCDEGLSGVVLVPTPVKFRMCFILSMGRNWQGAL